MALEKLDLFEREVRDKKPTIASGLAIEVNEEASRVTVDQMDDKKKARCRSRRRKPSATSDAAGEAAPLLNKKVTAEYQIMEGALNSAQRKKTRRRLRGKKRGVLVAGSHEAGD